MLRMNKFRHIATAMLMISAMAAGAQSVQVTATQDSIDVLQGNLRKITVEVQQPANVKLSWSTDSPSPDKKLVEIAPGVEVNWASAIDTAAIDGNRLKLTRTLLVQAWDSGRVDIPGIALVAGNDTFRSKNLQLNVLTVNVDSMTTVNPLMPVVEQPKHFWDWVPDWIADYWWAYLIGFVLIAGGIIYYVLKRKGGIKKVMRPAPAPVPPYDRALNALTALHNRKLCERGQEKEYYTELTEILREYLAGRFGINAMEMTTSQIKRAVRATVSERTATAMMASVLEMADYVKFAKMRPLPEDNERAFEQARSFVEDTKPSPEPEPAGKEDKK